MVLTIVLENGIILGYEDVNDHDKLRHDPALALALEKLNFIRPLAKVAIAN